MRKGSRNWWQRVVNFWDSLCSLCEQGVAWLQRQSGPTVRAPRLRTFLGVEQLETRLVPSGMPPMANPDSYSVHTGAQLSVSSPGVLSNDTDMEHDTLTAVLVSNVSHGTLSLNSNGSFSYTSSSSFTGNDSFSYKAYDGTSYSMAVMVTLAVTDTAPVANADSYTAHPGHTLSVAAAGVLTNDTDANGDSLTAVLVSSVSHGSLTLNSNGSFSYTASASYTGTDSFQYKASDGALSSNTVTVTLNVTNTAPVAVNDSYVLHGGSLSVSAAGVLANDTDAEGDSLTAVLVSGPSHGSLTLNTNGSFSYTAGTGFGSSDSFSYKANDGLLDSNTATVTINGASLSASGNTVSATAGTSTGTITVATATDTDTALTAADLSATIAWGDGSSTTIPASSGNGIVHNADGSFSIQASHTYAAYGVDTITVTVHDTVNNLTATTSATATIADPVSLTNPGTHSNSEGDTVSFSLSATNSGSGTLSFAAEGLPAGLRLNPSTGALSGTVALGAAADAPYAVTVTATNGTYSASQRFTWNISSPVTITNPGNQTNNEGDTVSLSISASDSSSGTLSYAAEGLPNGLRIHPSTGAISGTVAVGDAADGPYRVTVTASDGSYRASTSFTWTVNSPVTLAAIADQTSNEGASVSLSISATDSSSGTLAYTASGLPTGLRINTSSGTITGTVAAGAAANGPYRVTVTANDGTYSASQDFTWTVNSPISIMAPADQTSNEGDAVSLTVSASGPSTLTYGALGLPTGLSINASTGLISGTIAVGAAADGPFGILLLAGDGTYSAEAFFSWTVNSPISITTPDDQSNAAGDSVSLQINGSGPGTLSYSASGLPNGLSINSSSGLISGTLSAGGSFQPSVTVSNGTSSASMRFAWEVSSPISLTNPGDQSFNAGDAVALQVHATDANSGTLSYSASGLPSGLSINSSSGLISGTISSSLSAGLYTCTLTVTDGTATATCSFDWTIFPTSSIVVTNPGDQSNAEGASVSLSISASYSGSGTLRYAATGLPAGLTMNPSSGAITGTVSAGDAAFGPYDVTVTVTDGTASDSQTFSWTVSSPLMLTNPGTQSGTEGSSVSLSLSASYSGSGTLSYAAEGLPGGLSINASTGVIAGTVALGAAAWGPYDVTVEASVGSYSASQSFTWNISSPVTLTNPGDQTSSEGASVSLSLIATDSSSGTLRYAAEGLPAGLSLNTSTGAITGTVARGAAAAGPYFVTVTAADGTYSVSQSFTWTVNSPVTITTPTDQTSTEGASVSLSISATDSTSGTLRYGALGLPPGLVINPDTGAITGTVAAGASADGPYTVTVGAGDGTYSAQVSFTWTINSPISITTPPDQSNNEGDSVSLAISATDSSSGTLGYSATGLPNGLSINSSTGVISGTLNRSGFWLTSVTASDGTYSASTSFWWDVSSTITITDPAYQVNNDGDSVSLQITATDTASGTLSYSASGLPTGLSISSSSGLISGTISSGASASAPYTTTLTVTDGTHTASATFTWFVDPAGPIILFNPGSQTNAVGNQVGFFIQAEDTNGGTLTYTATGLPDGLHLNAFTGLVFGTIASDAVSGTPYSVTIEAADGSAHASQSFAWTVNAAGPVSMTNPGDQRSAEGDTVSLSISTSYSGSGTLRYVAFGLPAGLSINTDTGAITGTVAVGDATEAPYTVTVMAGDGTDSASQTFAWRVNSPVRITTPDDQTSTEGDSVSLSITASDSSSGTLSYAADGLPGGLAINPSTGAITGTVARGAAAYGPYWVTVVASDGTYSASASFEWGVTSPVTITVPEDQFNYEGDSVSLSISATDSSSGTLTYSALGLPSGLSINSSTGVISGTVAVGNASIGAFWVTLTATDGTYRGSASFEWDISSLVPITDPGDQANTVGDTVSLQIEATDTSSGTLTYAARGLPTGLSINTSSGLISGTISATAAAIGSFETTVTVSDGTYSASATFTWTVNAAGILTLATPSDQSNSEGDTVSLSLSASYSGSGTLAYFADGLPDGLEINTSTGAITGTVAVGDAAMSPYDVTVFVTDGTVSTEERFTWTVTCPVTIDAIDDQTNTEGDMVSLSVSASDSSSGTLSYSADGLPDGLEINTSTGAITGTIAVGAATFGPYLVTVTAGDGTYSASQSFTWTINSPITLTVPADQINYEGDTVTLSVSASDSSSGTVRYSAIGLPVGLSINTGTGAISGTIAVGAAASSPYSVLVTASDGTYSISQTFAWYVLSPISIIDPGEQFFSEGDTVSSQIEVIYSGSGTLTYSAVDDLPDGLWINSATGFISGTISGSTAALGEIFSVIRVTDGTTTAFQTILWNLTGLLVGQAKDLHLDTVVLDSWTEWATGDKITRGNLNSQINNYVTNIRREKSAALAVLKLYVLQKGGDETTVGSYADVFGTVDPKIGLTKKNLEQFATLRGGKGAPALVKRAQALDALFLDYVKYAESLKTPVAATSVKGLVLGSTTTSKDMAESIQQGIIGDCSFLAALINYVRATSPDDVVKRFKLLAPDKNGRQNFQVKLYDERGAEKWIDVQEPTYAERIIYGHGSIDTIWVALFEAAYVKMRLQEDPKFLNNPRLLDGGYLEQPVEADNIKSAISRLTGSRRSDFRAIQGFKDKEWALVLPTTTKPAVVSACTPKTLPREALAEGIVPYHAYAVISYDMDKGIVILRNPHNRPSVKGGAEVRLTLAQFRAWFVTLASDKTLSLGGN